MAAIVYYVASSLDGFIAGGHGDISAFTQGGPCVEQYFKDLQQFKTVIMGRNTYEFGYQFGLKAGQPAYAHMQHHIFSNSLHFDNPSDQVKVEEVSTRRVEDLKKESSTDIYLCGGGVFAGWLLEHGLIDIVKVKLNPIILNEGTRLFEGCRRSYSMVLLDQIAYEDGLQLMTYKVNT